MQSDFFDSFICNRGNCLDKISENSLLFNCFHTICSSHIRADEAIFCTDQLCAMMHTDHPNYITLPPKNKRCVNIVNNRLASHVVCLYNLKQRGAKCGVCDIDNGTLQFCTECPSILCQNHRQEPHRRLGPRHPFVDLTQSVENILVQSVRTLKIKTGTCNEFDEHIENLKINKESIDFSLVNLENSIKLVHNERLKLLEEADVSFTQIRLHIEKMQEKLLEQLNSKTDTFLRVLEQKRTLLQFQSAAASRAINLASFIQNTKIKIPQKFVDMFSTNSIVFIKELYSLPQPPIEHTNIPKIIKYTQSKLEDIHPINCNEHLNACYYFDCDGQCYPISKSIDADNNPLVYILLTGEDTTNLNWDCSKIVVYFSGSETPKSYPCNPVDPPHNCEAKKGTQIMVPLKTLEGKGKLAKVKIQLECYKRSDTIYPIILKFEKATVGISLFSITPGNLTGLACSNQKLFAINKNGKEILVFDTSQDIISQQMNREEHLPFKLVTKFGSNNLLDPNSIAAVRALIFVSDCTCHSLFCFSEEGCFIRKFGRFGTHAGEFKKPMGICGDQMNGRLVVADSGNERVQIFLLSSQTWNCFDIEELETKTVPIDVKLDTLGNFLVLTEANAIIKYDKNFEFPISILPSDTITPVMLFFAISRNDVIYLCSKENKFIYTIKRSRSEAYNFNKCCFTHGTLDPVGMTFDEHNRLYLAHNEQVETPNPTSSVVHILTQIYENESF